MFHFFKSIGYKPSYEKPLNNNGKTNHYKDKILKKIEILINSKISWKILHYSGHGEKDFGDWILLGKKKRLEVIKLDEIMELWKKRGNKNPKDKLFLILDCCSSNKWGDILIDKYQECKNVYM